MTPSALKRWGAEIEATLDAVLPSVDQPPRVLHEAMRYSVMAGGKRLRPVLALSAYTACGGKDPDSVLAAASALELFHTYSLIHDDLPSMDDDTLRRGKPTNHVIYGEAIATLAGDALQTLGAFLLITEPRGSRWTARRGAAAREILSALGSEGMVGGQVLDLQMTGSAEGFSEQQLLKIHNLKTGRFLEACVQAGALWAGARAPVRKALHRYGQALGLAFQIMDDILDETASSEDLGKTAGKDSAQGKATFPAMWGLEESRSAAQRLLSEALRALSDLGPSCQDLRELAHFVVNRGR